MRVRDAGDDVGEEGGAADGRAQRRADFPLGSVNRPGTPPIRPSAFADPADFVANRALDAVPSSRQADDALGAAMMAIPSAVEADDDAPETAAEPATTKPVGEADAFDAGLDLTGNVFAEMSNERPVLRHGRLGDQTWLAHLLVDSNTVDRWPIYADLARFTDPPSAATASPKSGAKKSASAATAANSAGKGPDGHGSADESADAVIVTTNRAEILAGLTAGLRAMLGESRMRVWVALASSDAGPVPIGFGAVSWRPDPLHLKPQACLELLFVAPTWRRRGVGVRLLHACRATARVVGAMVLAVGPAMLIAKPRPLAFFRNQGFSTATTTTGIGLFRTP